MKLQPVPQTSCHFRLCGGSSQVTKQFGNDRGVGPAVAEHRAVVAAVAVVAAERMRRDARPGRRDNRGQTRGLPLFFASSIVKPQLRNQQRILFHPINHPMFIGYPP